MLDYIFITLNNILTEIVTVLFLVTNCYYKFYFINAVLFYEYDFMLFFVKNC